MRALWSDRQNCSHRASQNFKRIKRLSGFTRLSEKMITNNALHAAGPILHEQTANSGTFLGNGSGILFREYCFGEENSLSLTEFGANSASSEKNSVSSRLHTNNRLRGTH